MAAIPSTSSQAVPSTSRQAVPGTSRQAVPGTSRQDLPHTSRHAIPSTSTQAVPGTSTQAVPGTSTQPITSSSSQSRLRDARPKPAYAWRLSDVQRWLRRHCGDVYFYKYSTKFRKERINGRALLRLNDNSLFSLGVADMEHRDFIWRQIVKLRLKMDIMEMRDLELLDTRNMVYDGTAI